MNTEHTPPNTAEDDPLDYEDAPKSQNAYAAVIEAMKRHLHRETNKDYYLNAVERDTTGPLREGFNAREINNVLKDTRTAYIALYDNEKPVSWPLLTPITHSGEYQPEYFDRTPEGRGNTYYLSLPSPRLLQSVSEQIAVGEALLQHMREGLLVVYDEYNGENKEEQIREYLAHVSDTDITLDKFIDPKNDTAAAAVQISAPIRFKPGAAATQQAAELLTPPDTAHDTIFIGHDPDDGLVEDLWHIYQRQFGDLTENFPRQILGTKEQFHRAILQHPSMHTVVRFEEGTAVATATFTDDISVCNWLNTSFYEETFPGEDLIHCLAIAASPDRKGALHSIEIIKAFARAAVERSSGNFRLTLQCTNASTDYIKRIVNRGISNYAEIAEETKAVEFGRYNFRGVRLAPDPARGR